MIPSAIAPDRRLYRPPDPIDGCDPTITEVHCPICGKVYEIPDGRGRAIVETRFLRHKDSCRLPAEDEFVLVVGKVAIVVEIADGAGRFPVFTVQYPSGRMREFTAREVVRLEDQEEGRRRFYA